MELLPPPCSDQGGVGIRLSQDDPVSEELEESVVVAEEDQSQRYGLMPLLRTDQGVELVEDHGAFQDDQYVQYPQGLVEKELGGGSRASGPGKPTSPHTLLLGQMKMRPSELVPSSTSSSFSPTINFGDTHVEAVMRHIRGDSDVTVTHGLVDVLVVFDQDPLGPHVLLCPAAQRGQAEADSGAARQQKRAGERADGYARVLEDVGAERGVHLLPAAQVSRGFVEQVAISGRQQVSHEYDGRADRDQDEELAGPALVHVLCTLSGGAGNG